jgi:diguanylate cyclase (GGDEF)-like protein
MTTTIRAEDVLARYGGEEFAIICREIEAEGARAIAERLRAAVEQHRFEHAGKVIPITISVGVAVARKVDDAQAFVAAADAAMYEAKRAGRNRVVVRELSKAPAAG